MFELVCVTSRLLCAEPFFDRIQALAEAGISGIILREKDLNADEYSALAGPIMQFCSENRTPCTLHTFADVATGLGCERLHLSLDHLIANPQLCKEFRRIGVSIHAPDEAKRAEELGAGYVTAGHVFETDCKKDLNPRGPEFLRTVCESVSIPVYAIGGILPENIALVKQAGAYGACIMSSLMQCENVSEYLNRLRSAVS